MQPKKAPSVPGFEPGKQSGDAQFVVTDEADRQLILDAAREQREYEENQKALKVARRQWENQRELANLNLMAQVPKLIIAVVFGALLAYVIPLGGDR